MPHLASFRKGWEGENLARFILYKFAFVAHPATVSDDIGSDFFCTLFETKTEANHDYLVPSHSFAIQVKSDYETFDVTEKRGYLSHLEIPFFVGVADRKKLKLIIYSGEYLPQFLAHKDPSTALGIELCEKTSFMPEQYCRESGVSSFVLRFPKIAEIEVDPPAHKLKGVTQMLTDVCSLTSNNIASRRTEEHIYGSFRDPSHMFILAGPGSEKVFRENFLKRLTEVFYNLKWIYENKPQAFSVDEFRIYEGLLQELQKLPNHQLPPYLTTCYEAVRDLVKR